MILSIKTSANLEMAIRLWEDLANSFREEGVDTLLLACTDLNIVLKAAAPHAFQIVDSSACLAETIVKKWEELRK